MENKTKKRTLWVEEFSFIFKYGQKILFMMEYFWQYSNWHWNKFKNRLNLKFSFKSFTLIGLGFKIDIVRNFAWVWIDWVMDRYTEGAISGWGSFWERFWGYVFLNVSRHGHVSWLAVPRMFLLGFSCNSHQLPFLSQCCHLLQGKIR